MKSSSIHKNIKLLAWFNFFTDFKLYAPVAIIYFAKISGSYALGMSIFSITMLSAAVFEMPTGIFSDLIGRKKTIVVGALASILYTTFYAIGGNYNFLVIGAILEGLSRSFYSGNNNALLYDSLTKTQQEAEYHTFLGKVSSMFQIGLAISAIAGGIIANWSFTLVMWLSVIPQILCLIVGINMIDFINHTIESTNVFVHIKKALKQFIKNKKLRMLSLASITSYALGESAYQFRSAFINLLWPIWAIGIASTLSNIGAAISFYFSGSAIKKFKEFKILVIGNIYNRIVNILALCFPSILSPILMTTSSLFYGVTSTAKENLLQKEFSSNQRATMGSLNSLFGSIAFAIVSFMLGSFADNFGPAKALLTIQIFMIAIIGIYWKLFKKKPINQSIY